MRREAFVTIGVAALLTIGVTGLADASVPPKK
jgi:hypothetical protein